MATVVENIREICKQKNIRISKIEKDLGFGNGYLNAKRGTDIPASRLNMIANYLDVSIDDLIGRKTEETATIADDGFTPDEKEFIRLLRMLPRESQEAVLHVLQGQVLLQTVRDVPGEWK